MDDVNLLESDDVLVAPLGVVGPRDVASVGGKAANLGALINAGFPVPGGFVVTAAGYLLAVDRCGLRSELHNRFGSLDPDDHVGLASVAAELSAAVAAVAVPDEVGSAVVAACAELGPARVAVRSSATAEDAAGTSFAGMHRSLLDVPVLGDGDERALIEAVRACWASLFSPRALAYRLERGLTAEPAIAVVVQQMVAPLVAGVLFSVDPAGDRNHLVVEAAWGEGETVVSGTVEPDTYRLERPATSGGAPRLVSLRVGSKSLRQVADPSGGHRVEPTPPHDAERPTLSFDEVVGLAELGLGVERHYGTPQDIEWAIDTDGVWLVQSRPITTLDTPSRLGAAAGVPDAVPGEAGALVHGLGASPGVASGPVRVVTSAEGGAALESGEVLVAAMTSPDWVAALRRASALVTDEGGVTCHAAIVGRELGIPVVVGAGDATRRLTTGTRVTVDGSRGTVHPEHTAMPAVVRPSGSVADTSLPSDAPLRTQLYVNLAVADRAEEVAAMAVDGVGLLRAEFLLADALGGVHPRQVLAEGRRTEFVAAMGGALGRITSAFAPRPVVYRFTDFRTNEFRALRGGEQFEPVEANPMIGFRGAYRYLREPEVFSMELEVLARVRDETPNLVVMLPFVRTRWELEACLELIGASDLGRQRDLSVWVMAEVPSVVHYVEEYAGLGIDGVSIGTNDLTQLILGVDRDSTTCADLFDESDPAVVDAIGQIITGARRANITSSLCGQAPSNNPAFAALLVEMGITSVSVNPDAVSLTRQVLADAETQLSSRRSGR